MDKFVGKRLDGRYEIQGIIGVGGMAVVYKARDNVEDRIVAIKILKDEFTSNEEFVRRFKNESKAIAMLSHTNIVKVYDVSFGDLIQYIVMEYIDGITLKEYIERQGSLRWKDAVHFALQILKGLQHAHDKGIVHRDVKPQNIMVLSDGTIKVTDFGIARFARSEQRTITDKAIGSVHYISPEQARGERTDEKADIYSVGVMLYEMLTGQVPFQAESAVSVAIMQLQRDPKPPTELNGSIPMGLEQITMHAMQKNADRRYQSAAEMLCDLDAFRKDPAKTFEYNYFVDDAPTRYVNSDTIRSSTPASQVIVPEVEEEEIADNKEKSAIVPILAGIAAALVIALIVIGIFVLKEANSDTGKSYKCHSFLSMTQEQIDADADINKKYDISYEYEFSEAPKGTVIKQSIKSGKSLKGEDNKIVLTVSKGTENPSVPNLENYEELAAKEILEDLGLVVKVEEIEDDKIAEGYVVKTDKAIGEYVAPGDSIILYVSSGAKVNVDEYVGQSAEGIEKVIKKTGLVLVIKHADMSGEDEYKPEGFIFKQEPAAGTTVKKGDTLTLFVSTGKKNYSYDVVLKDLPKDYESDKVTIKIYDENDLEIASADVSLSKVKYTYTFELNKLVSSNDKTQLETKLTVVLVGESKKEFEYMTMTVDVKTGDYYDALVYDDYPKSDNKDSDE